MTTPTSSSLAHAWRLPRDLALITVAVDAAMVLLNIGMQLWPDTPDSEQMRGTYALPGVWIPMAASLVMAWVLAAALAWSHARQALEVRGAASVAQLTAPRARYAGVYLVVLVMNYYALSPLLYELQLLFMPGGRLEDFFGEFGTRIVMALSTVMHAVVQLAVLVLGVWLAAWVALRRSADEPATVPFDDDVDVADEESVAQTGASPRRAVALLAAAVFASLQVWCAMVASRWTEAVGIMNGAALLLGWIAPPLVVFALAFWGGWLGTGPGLARVRPFKAVAASVLAFVLVQVSCMAVGFAWLMLMMTSWSSGMAGIGGLIVLVLVLVLLYIALTVLLTRAVMRRVYRSYL
ncbi:hypothetical protein DBV14_21295 [Variovorax sp. KBW07]|uniref:hypothetical protein n=1 Tax=Variovorax sp. KBW07 TaxID=2153358 RepID=UPI000F58115C|nr:hypothetical protein [Variovorax sp. KBW07]RQO47453.1 hypothetical protein DBV14_21295 [Variovorax sp. KBW07]